MANIEPRDGAGSARLTFEQLDTFRAIVNLGSFTRAAEELFLSQSAVSQRIRHIERTLGAPIFERRGRGELRLTSIGEHLKQFADDVLTRAVQLSSTIERSIRDKEDVFTIATGPASARYVLPEQLSLLSKYRRVRVVLLQGLGDEVLGALESGRADFGVLPESKLHADLDHVPLFVSRLVLISHPSHDLASRTGPISPAELANYPFALLPESTLLRQRVSEWASEHGVTLDVLVEATGVDAIKEIVQHGLCLAIVPELMVRNERRDGQLRVLDAEGFDIPYTIYLAFNRERPLSDAAADFVKIVSGRMPTTPLPAFGDLPPLGHKRS